MDIQDDRPIEIVDCDDTVLAILVYPDGQVRVRTAQPLQWIAETLENLRDTVLARIQQDGD